MWFASASFSLSMFSEQAARGHASSNSFSVTSRERGKSIYELTLLLLTFLLSLPDSYSPKGPFMITQQAFEFNSMKLSMQLPTDPSLPRGGFGVLLLSGDLHI